MRYFIKTTLLFLCLSIQIFTNLFAKDYTKMYVRERADIALKQCLDANYAQLGTYKKEDLKDYSGWTYNIFLDQSYTIDGSNALTEFVEKNTGEFYKENLQYYSELSPHPHNAIFARCMDFHRSNKLKQFLKKTKP